MKKQSQLFLPFLLLFLVSGCAHVISKDLRASSDLSLTLKQVGEVPDAYKGKSVIWGGDRRASHLLIQDRSDEGETNGPRRAGLVAQSVILSEVALKAGF